MAYAPITIAPPTIAQKNVVLAVLSCSSFPCAVTNKNPEYIRNKATSGMPTAVTTFASFSTRAPNVLDTIGLGSSTPPPLGPPPSRLGQLVAHTPSGYAPPAPLQSVSQSLSLSKETHSF